jgi:hypothetical protein
MSAGRRTAKSRPADDDKAPFGFEHSGYQP